MREKVRSLKIEGESTDVIKCVVERLELAIITCLEGKNARD